MLTTLTKNQIKDLLTKIYLDCDYSRVFWVSFITKDGSVREMECLLNVKKHLRGGPDPYDFLEKGLIPVCDMDLCRRVAKAQRTGQPALDKKGNPIKSFYRSLPLDRITHLSIERQKIEVV